MRILLVDDDELLSQTLSMHLAAQHHAIDWAVDGEAGWDYAQAATYDLIMLDINLPKLDGIQLCQRLRQAGHREPILLLTARGTSSDKVIGLDAGADDYVVKPCTAEELAARIRALLRRQQPSRAPILVCGDLRFDPGTCEVTYHRQPVSLSAKELSLLELFLRHPQRVFSSSIILEHLWGFGDTPGEETVRTHIKRLRRKLKAVGATNVIETIYGIGYRLNPALDRPSENVEADVLDQPGTPQSDAASTATEQARLAAIALWDQFKPPILERLTVLDQAVIAIESGHISDDLRQQAEYAAHKLAGSLGMFGFPDGSRLSGEIETALQCLADNVQAPSLKELISQLHRELEKPPKASDDEDWMAIASSSPTTTPPSSSVATPLTSSYLSASQEITVVAVDDDPAILTVLSQFLPRWGIHVIPLDDPRQLLGTLETALPDLLILDVEMSYIGGIELCQLIRRDRAYDGLPILFLSARRDADTIHRIYCAGADDYISKPFTEPEVVTRIFNRLERNRLLQNLGTLQRSNE